jgi:hypothetical protein
MNGGWRQGTTQKLFGVVIGSPARQYRRFAQSDFDLRLGTHLSDSLTVDNHYLLRQRCSGVAIKQAIGARSIVRAH